MRKGYGVGVEVCVVGGELMVLLVVRSCCWYVLVVGMFLLSPAVAAAVVVDLVASPAALGHNGMIEVFEYAATC